MVHTFTQGGLFFALDVASGAVHVIDALVHDILAQAGAGGERIESATAAGSALGARYGADELQSALREITALREQGLLYSEDHAEQYAGAGSQGPIKALCLHVAHDCNLRCAYCFAAQGDFGGGRCLMDQDTAKKAIDFLVAESKGRRNLECDFFGGEPLMNLDVVKETVRYARSLEKELGKNFRFTLTTNGVLLSDDAIDFLNAEMSNVVLSLDGRREVNDALRYTASGKGSYDVILPKFKVLVERRGGRNYYIRGTFTKNNLDFTDDVLHLLGEGFREISVEPAVLPESLPFSLSDSDLPAIAREYDRLSEAVLARRRAGEDFRFFHFMLDLTGGPCIYKRLRGCGCGNEYVAVSPEGDIYPCHQFVGIPEKRMGNLHSGTFDRAAQRDFSRLNVYSKPACRDCWAKYYCSGGCNANNYIYNGDCAAAHRQSCEMEKKRIECAIYLQAAEMGEAI